MKEYPNNYDFMNPNTFIDYSTQLDCLCMCKFDESGVQGNLLPLYTFLYEYYNPEGMYILERLTFNNIS